MSYPAEPQPHLRHRWLAKGRDGEWILQARPHVSRRVEMVAAMADLERRPHIPRSVVGFWRLLAYCATCEETVRDLPKHVVKGSHDIRFILVPDFRRRA